MADVPLPDLCLGIPIDHRLKPLLGTGLKTSDPLVGFGGHARAIEDYGRLLQTYGEDITNDEVNFTKWLAMPETKGGVVIVLLQPAEHQRYFRDHQKTVRDCDTLNGIDEVCKVVAGHGLEKISCFDAFPFHKIPVTKDLYKYEDILDEAYAIFLNMIQQKQPDVVFCCYRSPHSTKYKDFQCIGLGRTRDYQVNFQGRRYTCVNGFHPSYALNYLEDKSALRSLFMIEATQAFRRANGTWKESSWMMNVRENCVAIAKIEIEDKQKEPSWSRHDFQRERFEFHMNSIKNILDSLESDSYNSMTNSELYDHVLKMRYNLLFPNCLLLVVKIIDFEDYGSERLREKGFEQLATREDRDVRSLKRNVEKRCDEFLRSLRVAGALFQVEKGEKGIFTSGGLNKNLHLLGPFTHQSGFHYNLRLSFLKFVHSLNGAFTFKGRGVYEVNRNELAEAFRLAANYFEWALAQHAASTRRRVSEEDLSSQLNLLTINSDLQTGYATRPGFSQIRTAPVPSSTSPYSLPATPLQRPTTTTASLFSPAATSSSPRVASRFGVASPVYSPQTASSSRYSCGECGKSGHSRSTCPETTCYRCKGFGHWSSNCPVFPSPLRGRY